MISPEGILTKVPVNIDHQVCKTKVKNLVEKRTSTIKNVYNCGNDHKCDANNNEINAIECSEENATEEEEQIILVCAIDLIIKDQEPMHSSLITSDESMVISPTSTINESWTQRRNKSRTRRRGRKLGLFNTNWSAYKWRIVPNDTRYESRNRD